VNTKNLVSYTDLDEIYESFKCEMEDGNQVRLIQSAFTLRSKDEQYKKNE